MTQVHLVVLIHGLYGSPKNLAAIEEELAKVSEASEIEIVTHVAKSFTGSHTWDGVDVNAWKTSQEIDEIIDKLGEENKEVTHFSVLGYSLGGLVARYLAGLLHSRSPSFFARHRPTSFITAATPHLGVLKYQSRTNTVVHGIGRRLFSRSGQQLYGMDKDWDGRSTLETLADPNLIFLQALQLFPNVLVVANGCHDLTVPYPTATFCLSDPFEAFEDTGLQVDVDESHIVKSWHRPESSNALTSKQDRRIGAKRPSLPPILFLPYPFTYLLVFLLPLIIPLWLCLVSTVMILHTVQSARRQRQHRITMIPPNPSSDAVNTPLLSGSALHPRISVLSSAASLSGTSTPDAQSGRTSPITVDMNVPDDVKPLPGQTALLLTPAQKTMSRNLETHLPHVERVIAWFPWAFNAHALLIARDLKRFPGHQEGKGVVRTIAKYIVASTRNERDRSATQ